MFDEPGYMSLAIFADERSRPGHVGYRGMPVMERWQGGTQDWSWRCWVNARGRQPRNGRGQNEGTRGIEWWRGGLARRTDSAGLGRRAKEGFDAALLPSTTRSLRPHAPQSPSSPLQPRSTLNPQDPAKANSSAPPSEDEDEAAAEREIGYDAGIIEPGRAPPGEASEHANAEHVTAPYMTQFERARILGTWALQIRCVGLVEWRSGTGLMLIWLILRTA